MIYIFQITQYKLAKRRRMREKEKRLKLKEEEDLSNVEFSLCFGALQYV
jgi:hypothetical protein